MPRRVPVTGAVEREAAVLTAERPVNVAQRAQLAGTCWASSVGDCGYNFLQRGARCQVCNYRPGDARARGRLWGAATMAAIGPMHRLDMGLAREADVLGGRVCMRCGGSGARWGLEKLSWFIHQSPVRATIRLVVAGALARIAPSRCGSIELEYRRLQTTT